MRLAQGDAERGSAVAFRGVHNERPPSAADVEKALAGPKPELSAHEIQLRYLRVVEGIGGRAKIGARVHHPCVEPELVEVVSDIVVILNGGAVARRIVPASLAGHGTPRSPRTDVGGPVARWKGDQMAHRGRNHAGRLQPGVDRVAQAHRVLELSADVHVSGEKGFDDRQLAGRKQHPAKRSRSPQNKNESRVHRARSFRLPPPALDGAVPVPHIERAVRWRAE